MMAKKPGAPPAPTARKATASDVAARAGVSKWTVSRAFTDGASISPHALLRVQTAARELGYRPNLLARSLSKKSTRIIGLVADELKNPHIFTLLDEVTRQLQSRGYMALLLNITSENDYESVLTLADQMQVDGLLFLGTLLNDRLIALAQDIHHIPLVVLYRYSESPYIQVLATNGYQAGREIGELLLTQNYQRMGYLAGPVSESTQLRRLDGFRAALAEKQRDVSLVLQAPHYQRLCGMEAFAAYLADTPAEQRIEAIFCENDILAVGVIDAIRATPGCAPIAVVGFDDIELAASPSYQLTTYRQPMQSLIADGIHCLTQAFKPGGQRLYNGELIVRQSHIKQP
ncbi:LacI family DNA-binding transcriptional regulator [Serratia quinivorans]|uniref:LacI family DNA-binding transcriptional regulator n=2 Tax=Serratia quinivorans TaxID=137545 RepID=UPI00217B0CFD|nr:LacI family DNA-binding transcriptional regulator [Serratia quinivorans]CAI0724749.1 Purine nucleotide synthesis repressor [Serratia quinivorans]CAI0750248.1 Purine nucleotide synthesis repressor [Serratia quinivorans]CAI1659803.1 Purine nucleotide synthesis repressor [Serratia quinivorans]CAI2049053.1 Purine nucleotide synthesis repressor [Serratia quinivorans]